MEFIGIENDRLSSQEAELNFIESSSAGAAVFPVATDSPVCNDELCAIYDDIELLENSKATLCKQICKKMSLVNRLKRQEANDEVIDTDMFEEGEEASLMEKLKGEIEVYMKRFPVSNKVNFAVEGDDSFAALLNIAQKCEREEAFRIVDYLQTKQLAPLNHYIDAFRQPISQECLSASSLVSRMTGELKELMNDPIPGIEIFLSGALFATFALSGEIDWKTVSRDMIPSHWYAFITANNTNSNAVYLLDIFFPSKYPFIPPIFSFVTPVYHAQVDEERQGRVVLDLVEPEYYSPAFNISELLLTIQSLLASSFECSSTSSTASAEVNAARVGQEAMAREWMERYPLPKKWLSLRRKHQQQESTRGRTRKAMVMQDEDKEEAMEGEEKKKSKL